MASQATAHLRAAIAANIDAAIVRSGKTNREIAERMGASETQVWKWRKGKHGIGQANLVALADALDLDYWWFYADHPAEPTSGAAA